MSYIANTKKHVHKARCHYILTGKNNLSYTTISLHYSAREGNNAPASTSTQTKRKCATHQDAT